MISIFVSIALTYFSLRLILWMFNLSKDKEDPQIIVNFPDEKIVPKPLNLPPDPKVQLSLKDINNSNDTNFKNLLVKKNKLRRNHITVSVNYM